MSAQGNRWGRTAVAAGVLMTAGVEGEWLLNPQQDDGTVTNKPAFALLLVLSTVGFVLLTAAVRGLRAGSAHRTRPARVGSTMSLVGAGLLVVFGLLVLVTGLAQGSPLEASFLAFALGLLLLAIGPVVWGISLRRQPPAPGVWQMLVLAGALAFASLAIPLDPWHDVTLVAMFLSWSVIGVLQLRPRPTGARRYSSFGASSRDALKARRS